MIFGFLTDSIENALDVADKTLDPFHSGPSKRQVAQLIDDGLTIGAIASGFGVAEDVIEGLLNDQ